MSVFDPRDRSKTAAGKTFDMVKKNTQPPKDQSGWMAITRDLLESPSYRTLSVNGRKALDRLIIEHIGHGRLKNGQLVVTHDQFIDYGVTGEYVADAIDELEYKGLLKADRGRAGAGTAHPTIYRLTFDGTHEGLPASNEWKKFTMAEARLWSEVVRQQRLKKRSNVGRKKKTSLRDSEIRPLWVSEIRRRSEG